VKVIEQPLKALRVNPTNTANRSSNCPQQCSIAGTCTVVLAEWHCAKMAQSPGGNADVRSSSKAWVRDTAADSRYRARRVNSSLLTWDSMDSPDFESWVMLRPGRLYDSRIGLSPKAAISACCSGAVGTLDLTPQRCKLGIFGQPDDAHPLRIGPCTFCVRESLVR
jgi:hypothetical protein